MCLSSLFCLSYLITIQIVLQVSEEGTHGRCEDDRGGQENDGLKVVIDSKVILCATHYLGVLGYMMVLIGRLNMPDNDLIIGQQVKKG